MAKLSRGIEWLLKRQGTRPSPKNDKMSDLPPAPGMEKQGGEIKVDGRAVEVIKMPSRKREK